MCQTHTRSDAGEIVVTSDAGYLVEKMDLK